MKTLTLVTLLACFTFIGFFAYEKMISARFDSFRWKAADHRSSGPYLRAEMADDLIRNQVLDHKTREEVIQLLGEPFHEDANYFDSEDLVYWLGPERSWVSIDTEWLVINLDETGKVIEYKVLTD